MLERFLDADGGGDLQSLMDVIAPDIVLITDGGGSEAGGAATDPRRGEGAALPGRRLPGLDPRRDRSRSTAGPALRLELDGELEAVATFTIEGGLVTGAYIVRNPHKLAHLDGNERVLTR